jgi:hypothetical protein
MIRDVKIGVSDLRDTSLNDGSARQLSPTDPGRTSGRDQS